MKKTGLGLVCILLSAPVLATSVGVKVGLPNGENKDFAILSGVLKVDLGKTKWGCQATKEKLESSLVCTFKGTNAQAAIGLDCPGAAVSTLQLYEGEKTIRLQLYCR